MNLDFPTPVIRSFCLRAAGAIIIILSVFASGSLRAQTPTPVPVATPVASPVGTPAASPTASMATTAATTAKEDLVSVIKAAGNFKTFLKAVEAADLTSTLQKPGPLTVFAPTDTAFSKMPASTLDDLLKPENKAKLVKLLSYHVASGKLTATDLVKTDEIKTLEGTDIDVDASADGKIIEVDDAKILGSDIEASNGVLHAIDSVLQP